MRGRNNNGGGGNRKGPNPLTRSYESNGPDVKIRGTAHHIAEKYLQLARDAQSSGDPVMAESYLQHAEHYFRLIASAQQAQQQAAPGYQRPAGEQPEPDDGEDDDDFTSLPDRFASPAERVTSAPPVQQQPYGERQPFDNRGDRYERQGQGQDRGGFQDRQSQGDRQDRPERQDRAERQERYDNRQDRRPYNDRNAFGERQPFDNRGQDRNGQDRNSQDRGNQDRGQGRDFDNRGRNRGPREFRNEYQPRDNAPREGREPRQSESDVTVSALPAFITAPMRVQPEAVAEPVESLSQEAPASAPEGAAEDAVNFAMRPRRRRRTKAEFAETGDGAPAPASDPVAD